MTTTRSNTVPDPASITVGEAMHPGVFTCTPETPLERVAALMAERRIHCVVVSSEAGEAGPWGVVSDLDLTASIADLGTRTARTAAATPVVMITPHEPLTRAAQLMNEYGTTHLVVVDPATGAPKGVISTLDVARAVSRPFDEAEPIVDYDEPVLVHEP